RHPPSEFRVNTKQQLEQQLRRDFGGAFWRTDGARHEVHEAGDRSELDRVEQRAVDPGPFPKAGIEARGEDLRKELRYRMRKVHPVELPAARAWCRERRCHFPDPFSRFRGFGFFRSASIAARIAHAAMRPASRPSR